jgi:preprotein translocase subunit SecF
LLTAAALFVFGGEVIHDFALAIMLGIIVGTYSSIFVASPIVLMLGKEQPFSKK